VLDVLGARCFAVASRVRGELHAAAKLQWLPVVADAIRLRLALYSRGFALYGGHCMTDAVRLTLALAAVTTVATLVVLAVALLEESVASGAGIGR
jgi:hypothetical protein